LESLKFQIDILKYTIKEKMLPGSGWLTPVILATQEAKIRRISVPSQPGQIVPEILFLKNPSQKRAGGMAQGVGPDWFQTPVPQEKKK
jgi:hypothetical protein